MRTRKNPDRLLPGWSFPEYAYVPRKFPHPKTDSRGRISEEELSEHARHFEDWRHCDPYRFGVDLFNYGYYWEAHEAWEAVWHAVGRKGAAGDFLKGLIALAAVGVKAREGSRGGVATHARRAGAFFEGVRRETGGSDRYWGLDLGELRAEAERLAAGPEGVINTSDAPVVSVMPFALVPVAEGG